MTLTYIFHSGFAISSGSTVIIFDYWLDPAGVVPKILSDARTVYVLSSHFHEDHFTKNILAWRKEYPLAKFTYIFSKDIYKHRRADKSDADVWLAKGGEWTDGFLKVSATGSNDSGVSWVIDIQGKTLFHAGDLNNWYARFLTDDYAGGTIYSEEFGKVNPRKEEKLYLGELKDIAKITTHFDLVMFPIDGRIGNGYTSGGRQFINKFGVGLFVPMHFVASGFESAWRMKDFTDEKGIRFWCISAEGESIDF